MKVCKLCGETYGDHVDFCFVDGEVLAERPLHAVDVDPKHLEAPDPGRLGITPDGEPRLDPSAPTRSATPLPRSRRSLLQRAAASQPSSVTPPSPRTAAEEKMTPTPVMTPRQEETAPPPLTPSPLPPEREAAPEIDEDAWLDTEVVLTDEPEGGRRAPLALAGAAVALLVAAVLCVGLWPAGGGDAPRGGSEPPSPAPASLSRAAEAQVGRQVEPEVEPSAEEPPPEERALRTAPVRFETTPSGALVRIGGQPAGRTPLKLDLPLGDHAIRVELDGYQPLSREIEVSPGENLVPTWTLLPQPSPPEPAAQEPVEAPTEVPVRIEFAGQQGALLRIDGGDPTPLPAELDLSEGVHVFEVSGASGTFRVRREVRRSTDGGRVELQLGQ